MHHEAGAAGTCHCSPNGHGDGEVCHCNHNANNEHSHVHDEKKKSFGQRLRPYLWLNLIIIGTLIFGGVATYLSGYYELHVFLEYSMAAYFLAFGILQTVSLKKSAKMLQQYDPLAKRFPAYGYIYPILQILIGIGLLFWISPLIINAVAAIIVLINLVGVMNVLEEKKTVRCGCLGETMNVPVSWVTLTENIVMLLLCAGMVVYFFATMTPTYDANGNEVQKGHHHKSI